jgi:hypothetical protein
LKRRDGWQPSRFPKPSLCLALPPMQNSRRPSIGANALHRRERKLSGLTGLAEPESAPTLSRSSPLKGGSHDDGPTTLHHVRDVEAHKQRRLPLNETDIRNVKRNLDRLDEGDQLLFRVLAATGMRLSEAFEIDGEMKERTGPKGALTGLANADRVLLAIVRCYRVG